MDFNFSPDCELLWQRFGPCVSVSDLRRGIQSEGQAKCSPCICSLQVFKSIGDAACSLGRRDLSPALGVAIHAWRLTGQPFDLLLSVYFNPKLSFYCAMEDLSTGHRLMLYSFNKYQKDFTAASLYLWWKVTFQPLFITIKVMQVRNSMASLYICQLGSQTAENLFSITRTLSHNRNFVVLQLRDRLQAVLDIHDILFCSS